MLSVQAVLSNWDNSHPHSHRDSLGECPLGQNIVNDAEGPNKFHGQVVPPPFVSEEAGCGLKQDGPPRTPPEVLFVKIARKSHFIVGWGGAGWWEFQGSKGLLCGFFQMQGFGAKGLLPLLSVPAERPACREMAGRAEGEAGGTRLFQTRKGFPGVLSYPDGGIDAGR